MYKKSIIGHLVRFVVALAVAVSASGAQVGAALAQPNAATSSCIRPTVVNVDSAAWEKYLKCLDDHNLPTPVKSQFSNSWCNPPSVNWTKVPETERTGRVWDQFKACMYAPPKDHLYDPFLTGELKYLTPDNSRPIVILLQGLGSDSHGDTKYCLEPEQSLGNVAKELVAVGYVCGQDLIAFSYNGLPSPVWGHYDFPSYDCPATLQKIETSVTQLFDYVRVAKEKWPNRQVQLIGFSLGAVVAMQALVRSADNPQRDGWFKDKISGVITFDSPLLGFPKPASIAALSIFYALGLGSVAIELTSSIDELRHDNGRCFTYSFVSGGSPFASTLGTAPNSSPTLYEENGKIWVRAWGLNWAKWALAKTYANQRPILARYQKLLRQELSSKTKIINVINTNSVIQLGSFERYDPGRTGENGLLLCVERHPCHRWDLGAVVLSEDAFAGGHDAAPKACWSRREALREAGLISIGRESCGEMDGAGLPWADGFERRPPAVGAGGRPGGPISPPKKLQ